MAKQGVWGDQMRIIVPILYKRVTCATCCNYCHEDHACIVKPVVPRVDGYDYWKRCEKFDLASEYNDAKHREQVMREKGTRFVHRKSVQIVSGFTSEKNEKPHIDMGCARKPMNVQTVPQTFVDKFVASAWLCHGLEFSEISIPLLPGMKDIRLLVNKNSKMIVITMPKVNSPSNSFRKAMTREQFLTRLWTSFSDKLNRIVRMMIELENTDDYEKWIVMPVIHYNEEGSCGEIFYRTNGKALHGIKLVELDDDGSLVFATGPVYEKYWTSERIRDLKIFK